MKPKRLLVASTICFACSPIARSADVYWDNLGGTANDWTSLANWSTDIAGGIDPLALPGASDTAIFSANSVGAVQTVNLNGDQSLSGIGFTSSQNHSLLGGGTNRILTLGTGGINKSGSAALTIGSATAGQQVSIALGADQTWTNTHATGTVSILNGVSSNAAGARVLTLSGTNTLNNHIAGVVANGSGTVSLVKNGTGTWILSGANTYTGGTTINGGTLAISAAAGTGTAGGNVAGFGTGSVTVNTGGTAWIHGGVSSFGTIANALTLGGGTLHIEDGATTFSGLVNVTSASIIQERWGDIITFSNVISGAGALTFQRSTSGTTETPVFLLNGTNTTTGTITAGANSTLRLGNNAALGNTSAGTTVASGGVLDLNGRVVGTEAITLNGTGISSAGALINSSATASSLSGTISLASASSIGGSGAGLMTLSGVVSGAGTLTKVGSGTVLLSGVNTYATATTVAAGTLQAGNAAAFGTTAGGVAITSGAVVDLNGQAIGAEGFTLNGTGISSGGALINSSATAASLSGNISLASASSVGGTGTGAMTLSGIVSGANTLTKVGTGAVILSGANTYSGATTVSAGLLRLNAATSLPGGIAATGGTANLSLNGGTLGLGAGDFTRGLGTAANQIQIAGVSGFSAHGAVRTVNFGGANAALTWGAGSFAPTTLLLSHSTADNTLVVSNPISLGAAARTVQVLNGSAAIDGQFSGILSGSGGSLVKTGDGTLVLSGANTFTGGLNPKAGTVQLNSAAGAGTGTISFVSADTGRIAVSGGVTIANNITVGTGVAAAGSRGLIEYAGTGQAILNGTLTLSGLTSSGGVIMGSNTAGNELVFNGAINETAAGIGLSQRDGRVIYKGGGNVTGTFVSTGTVIVGATNGLPQGLVLNLGGSAAATLNLNGFNQASGGLLFGFTGQAHVGTVNLGANTLSLTGGITTQGSSPAHVINGNAGSGTLFLGAVTRSFTVADATAADDLTLNNAVISGSGGFTKLGAGTLNLNGTTGDAPITLTGGTLRGAFTTTGGLTVNTGTTLVPGSTTTAGTVDTSTLAFDSGTHSVQINLGSASSDLINVTGLNGFTTSGGTTTIAISTTGGFSNASTFYPIFTYSGSSPGLTGFALGALPGRLAGSLTDSGAAIGLTATNDRIIWTGSASGAWDVNTTSNWKKSSDGLATNFLSQDDIIFNNDGLAQPTITLVSPAVYNPTRIEFSNTSGTYTLSGSGSITGTGVMPLIKSGAGTVVLDGTGAHSYTGATTVSAGTLSVNQAASGITATSGVDVASSATLRLFSNNADFNFSRSLTGAGTVIVDGNAGGTAGARGITLSGVNTGFTGDLQLTPSGTLAVNGTFRLSANQNALGSSTVTVNDRAQLWPSGSISNNLTITGAGFQEAAGGTPLSSATGADGSSPTPPSLAYGGIGAIRADGITLSGSITLAGDSKITAYGATATLSGSITNTAATDDLVIGGGGSGATVVLTGNNPGLDRIWVNGGSTAGTHTLVVGNNTATGTLGSDDVILYNDAAGAGIRFQRSDGYTFATGQDIIAAHNGTAANLSKSFVQINTTGTGLDIGGSTIDLSDGTNGGTINIGTNISGASFTMGTGSVVQAGNLYLGEQTGNSTTVNQNGGAVSVINQLRVGHWGSETSTYNLSSGSLDVTGASQASSPSGGAESNGGIYLGIDGRGVFNQSGGTVTTNWVVLDNRGDTGVGAGMASDLDQYNLSGGILDIKSTWGVIQRNTAELNLSGGTVRVNNTGTGTGTGANLTIPLDTTINVSGIASVLDTNGSGNKFTLTRNVSGSGTLTTTGGGEIQFSTTGTQSVNAIIAGTSPVVKLGSGTTTFAAANTYSGTTTVSAGTLNLTGSLANSDLTLSSGATIRGEGSAKSLTLGGGNLFADPVTSSGALTGTSGLAVSGTNNVDFTSLPSSNLITILNYGGTFTGSTGNFALVNSANYRSAVFADTGTSITLDIGSTDLVWTGTGGSSWNLNTTSNWNDANPASQKFYIADRVNFDDSVAADQTIAISGTLQPAAVTVNNSVRAYTLTASAGNIISGPSGLLKKGSAVLTMAGNVANTFTGGTVISQGEIRIQNAGSLGTGSITLGDSNTGAANTSLYLDTNRQSVGLAITVSNNGTGAATIGSRATVTGSGDNNQFSNIILARDVIFDSNAADRTDYENISGTGDITVTGTGRSLFMTANTWSGDLTVSTTGAGVLQIGTVSSPLNAIPDTANVTVSAGALLNLSVSGNESINSLNGAGTIGVNSSTSTLTVGAGNGGGTFSGILQGAALSFTKSGNGTQILSGNNTAGGLTTVSGGTLRIGVGGTSGSIAGALTVNAGAIATVDRSDASVLAGALNGDGTFNKNGAGSYTFNAGGAFNGTININGGSIIANATNPWNTALAAPAFNLAAGTELSNTGASAHIHIGNITMAGGSSWTTGSGTGSYDGENYQLNGDVTVSGGSSAAIITREGSRTNANSGVALRGSRTFNVSNVTGNAASDLTISTELENPDSGTVGSAGPGGVIKSGLGTMTFTAVNSYTGATAVNVGTLLINGSNTGGGLVTVASGATLGGTGSITGAVNVTGVISPGASIESLTTGSLSMLAGSALEYELEDATGAGADRLDVAGDLSLTGLVSLNLTKIGSGSWSLNDKLTLISYSGLWNSGLFTYDSNTVADDSTILFDGQQWVFNYDDTVEGANFASGSPDSFVTMTVIPEPAVSLLGGLGALALLRRRRVK